MTCHKCDDLREEIRELQDALSVYERPYNAHERWDLPGYPELKLQPLQRHFLRLLYERRGMTLSRYAMLDTDRPKSRVDTPVDEKNLVGAVICHLRKALRPTKWQIINNRGYGYTLTERPFAAE